MAISFTSATGNLFNRLGKLGLLLKQVMTYQAAQLTNFTNTTTGAVAQYNAESDIQALIGSDYIGSLNGIGNSIGSLIQNVADQTVNRIVFRDNPQLDQTLTSLNTLASIVEIIRQMKGASASILAMTITATPSAFTGTGNGVVNAGTKRPVDGLVLENSFAETLTLRCIQDSYIGGATAFNEAFELTGQGSAAPFDFNWPLGSNANTQLNAIDGSTDNGSGNVQTNSDYEDWAVNVPDNFTITAGATQISKESSVVYSGTYALKLTGDGTTGANWQQTFNSSSGTLGTLSPLTEYSVNIFMRRDGTPAANGTLTVDLIDGSNAVIADANAVNNTFAIDLTALTASYAGQKGVFRTPEIMPSTYSIRYRLTGTALTTARAVYMDKMSVGQMTQAYTGGPFAAIHAGSTPFIQGGGDIYPDFATIAVTNSRGAAGTLSTFQTLLWRLLNALAIENEILYPSDASPTISDTLIG